MRVKLAFLVAGSAGLAVLCGLLGGGEAEVLPAAGGERRPVVVELFTSEGCSSCPPADRLLADLDRDQPVPGAEIVVLGWHVDYWNRLGWTDPFSAAEFTGRQYEYSEAFGTRGAYTPQMVVDGQAEFVGSDALLARRMIARAGLGAKVPIQLERGFMAGKSLPEEVSLRVRVEPLPPGRASAKVDVLLAITEDGLGSNVTRGENAGKRLEHRGVVRRLTLLGTIEPGKPGAFSAETKVSLQPAWEYRNLRFVVLLQESRSRHILGAAALRPAAE